MNIQHFLNDYSASRKLNGSILVAIGDRIVAEKNLGFADFNSKIACNRNTQYQIGSVTKQFTAVAVLKAFSNIAISNGIVPESPEMLEAVKSLLHKPIVDYLPATVPLWANKMPAWAEEVTVHQLLQHSSGIPSYTSFTEYKEKFFTSPPNQVELIGYFKDKDLEFTPGSMFSYCNSGYILLGAIVEQLAQKKLSKYLEQNIFNPLAMHGSSFPEYDTVKELKLEAKYKNLSAGYEFDVTVVNPEITEVKKYLPMQVPGPAGAMISTAPDLLSWNNALFCGKVISNLLLNVMLNSTISTGTENSFYAYGLEGKISASLGTYYFHGGGIDGYKSMLTYIPKLDMSIICLTNLVGGGDEFWAEVYKINASIPHNLSDVDKNTRLKEALQKKFPMIAENKDTYNATVFADVLVSELEREYE